jgi:threonine dehydratase
MPTLTEARTGALSMTDVLRAQRVIAPHLPPTPCWSYPALDRVAGAQVYVKHENTQPTGAFKVRGGLNLLAGLSESAGRTSLVAYSTGNHAQSIAYAARVYGMRCTVVMPVGANPAKVAAVEAYGATVLLQGADMSAAQPIAAALAEQTGARLVHPDEAPLIAGVATLFVELLTAVPDLDAVYVPVGSGTGAAAACLVTAALAPRCRVIAVQSAAAPAAHDSWRAGTPVTRPIATRIEGLATGRAYTLPQSLLGPLADFVVVDDDAIDAARRRLATHAHTLAEGAGAAALAAVLHRGPRPGPSGKVAVICTGGNACPKELGDLSR